MKYSNIQILVPTPMDSNATSAVVDCNQVIKLSLQSTITGSGTIGGSLQMQVSNDLCPYGGASASQFVPTNWSNLGSPITLSTLGSNLTTQQDFCYRWLRVVYTDSISDATAILSANIMLLSI